MKYAVNFVLLFLCIAICSSGSLVAQQTDSVTVIFVRHAEKADDGSSDPVLNEAGEKRAVKLSELLQEKYDNLAAVFSTPYNRTRLTAAPAAERFGLEITEYNWKDPDLLLSDIASEYAGKTVLIVGHSNTTPHLVNKVIGEKRFEQLDEKQYNLIFITRYTKAGEGTVSVSEYQVRE